MSQLVKKIVDVSATALSNKALVPIHTKRVYVEPYYLISVVVGQFLKTSALESEIDKKEKKIVEEKVISPSPKRVAVDPFRPSDDGLCVERVVAPHHSLVLNKFCVIQQHLLLITTEFEAQVNHLNRNDWYASLDIMKRCQDDRIGFYNRGLYSGASQPHKHIQFVPSEDPDDHSQIFPLPAIFNKLVDENPEIKRVPFFPFKHGFIRIGHIVNNDNLTLEEKSIEIEEAYFQVLRDLDAFREKPHDTQSEGAEDYLDVQCGPEERHQVSLSMSRFTNYNLLFNSKWLLVVLRSQENHRGISCNSLAFLHGFFAKNDEQLKLIREEIGVEQLLSFVTIPQQQ